MTLTMDRRLRPLPGWARLADLLLFVFLVLALVVALTGGMRERVWGGRVSITSAERILLWALAVFAVRHVLAPRPSVFARTGAWLTGRRRVAAWVVAGSAVLVIGAIVAGVTESERTGSQDLRALSGMEARRVLFEEMQPSMLRNCTLKRFGEPHDGGYLLCDDLLASVGAGYSYGISGYDGWGCDVSRGLGVTVHEYDCFDTRAPACPGGSMQFHAECVAGEQGVEDGRLFDTMENQFARNGDLGKQIVLKMDVEGAEWPSIFAASDETLERIDQIAIEFHGVDDPRSIAVVRKLKTFFYLAHVHHNNYSCDPSLEPFPAWAYEALFVSKRLGKLDHVRPVLRALRLAGPPETPAAPNNPRGPDCQVQ